MRLQIRPFHPCRMNPPVPLAPELPPLPLVPPLPPEATPPALPALPPVPVAPAAASDLPCTMVVELHATNANNPNANELRICVSPGLKGQPPA